MLEQMMNHPVIIEYNNKWIAQEKNPHKEDCNGYAIWETTDFIKYKTGIESIQQFCKCFWEWLASQPEVAAAREIE